MQYYSVISALLLAASGVSAHGLLTRINGANGVTMPALSLLEGTPRDCASPTCKSEDDTSIIRNIEIATGRASALGRTPKGGKVDPERVMAIYMGMAPMQKRQVNPISLTGLLSGNPIGQFTGGASDGKRMPSGTMERGLSTYAGMGAQVGLPTTTDDGVLSMTYHQVNQDGAGPMVVKVDYTSGGKDPNAFQSVEVLKDVPGIGISGLSTAAVTSYEMKIRIPEGQVCRGVVMNVRNVCIVRVQNGSIAGPFGGSGAFTQPPQYLARYQALKRRHIARGTLAKN